MDASASKKRIVILGGGFGGVVTARHLEGLFRRRPDVEIVLVSRDNFLLMTPLLFEVFSGALGHGEGFGQLLKVRVHGFPAWLLRRTYYPLKMPGWGRRLRILIDWTFDLL